MGQPIELDAASNNSVDDIRRLIEDAQTQAIDSEYKVFIIDECHMITPQGWNAFLKTLEEPPTKAIFIMATTNPEKIPATILSRVQRYNFQKISTKGIMQRLTHILHKEDIPEVEGGLEAVEYIAKIAEGGMRDAITMLDKCLSYNLELTVENVSKALGVADYTTMFALTQAIVAKNRNSVIQIIQNVYDSGFDMKLFIKQYFEYVLNLTVYGITGDVSLTTLPSNDAGLENLFDHTFLIRLTDMICQLNYSLKYEQNPRVVVLARVLTFVEDFK